MNKADLLNKAKSKLYIRNYSPRTIASYISSLNNFAEWLIQEKVNQVTDKEVEKYLYHLKKNRNRSISGMKQTVASLKILFTDILKKEIPDSLNIRFRKEEKIPVVLSEEEVAAVALRACGAPRAHQAADPHRGMGKERRLPLRLHPTEPRKAGRAHHTGRAWTCQTGHRCDASARANGRGARDPGEPAVVCAARQGRHRCGGRDR